MKKLNVFFHINLNNNSAGGIINFLRDMLKLIDKEWKIDYYTLKYSEIFSMKKSNVNQIFLKEMKLNPNKKKIIPHNLIYLWELFVLMIKKRFTEEDILLFNRADNTLPAMIFQKKAKKVLIIHGSTNIGEAYDRTSTVKRSYNKFAEKMAIEKFDKIIFVAHDDLFYYQKKYSIYKEKFIWIPTFLDGSVFNNDIEKKDCINEDKTIHYIFFGRFVEQKGMKRLAKYLKYLDKNLVDYKMTLIGEGELRYLFEDMDKVEIVNTISQKEIVGYLRSKVILIMLSRWEGMPLTLIEALATGTPAICSIVGEMKYIIKNGYNGYSFDLTDDSYEEMFKSSMEIWNNYSEFSINSTHSISDFLIDIVVEKYNKLFLEL